MRSLGNASGIWQHQLATRSTPPERVEGGAVLRQRRRPYLGPVRHPILGAIANQAGHGLAGHAIPWTRWTLAATRLIIHHLTMVHSTQPAVVAGPTRRFLFVQLSFRSQRDAAAAAAHPGRAGIPLSIQLVGHESGPGSAEACLPNPQHVRRQGLDSMPPPTLSPLPVAVLTHRFADRRAA
jgi:hypothetical protein